MKIKSVQNIPRENEPPQHHSFGRNLVLLNVGNTNTDFNTTNLWLDSDPKVSIFYSSHRKNEFRKINYEVS